MILIPRKCNCFPHILIVDMAIACTSSQTPSTSSMLPSLSFYVLLLSTSWVATTGPQKTVLQLPERLCPDSEAWKGLGVYGPSGWRLANEWWCWELKVCPWPCSSESMIYTPELPCGVRLKLLSQELAEIKAVLLSPLLGFSLLLLGALPCTLIPISGLASRAYNWGNRPNSDLSTGT